MRGSQGYHGLSVHLCEYRVSLSLGQPADLLGLGLSLDDELLLVDLGRNDDVGLLGSPLPLGTGKLGVTLALVGLLEGLRCLNLLGCDRYTRGLGLLLAALGVRVCDVDLGSVLSLHGEGVCRGSLDTGISLGLSDSDVLVPVGLGLTDLTVAVLLGHALLGVVDGLGGGFLTESLDVAGTRHGCRSRSR